MIRKVLSNKLILNELINHQKPYKHIQTTTNNYLNYLPHRSFGMFAHQTNFMFSDKKNQNNKKDSEKDKKTSSS